MHILGKTLLWFCMLLAIGATYLTIKLLDNRHKWLTDVQARQAKVEQNATQLTDLRRRVRLEEEKMQGLVQEWGDVWVGNNSGPQPGNPGTIEIGVGGAAGIRPPEQGAAAPVAFTFATDANGQSKYLGEFRLTDLAAGRLAAKLIRPPYPDEVASWPIGQYHFRQTLPGNWLSAMADIESQTIVAQARLDSQQAQLAVLQKQNQDSQAALDQRLNELNGDPTAPPDTIPEIKDGLVETVRKHEAVRNQSLNRIDGLRLKLDDLYMRMRNTLDRNRQLVDEMQRTDGAGSRPANAELPALPAVRTATSR